MTETKKVQSDTNDLKASLEHTETVLEDKVAIAEKKVENFQEQINELCNFTLLLLCTTIGSYRKKNS